ncbi:nitroreductase family protein [Clostridium aciditolerans]|uniref:Nitroreductase family protein n=1 Tax=Clostridium aciditolerans TaxID=339861 RepID=A0A934HVD7_9CLOT|nr:nitroreductase family protein [Clostridium aciditolerans]MBI6872094.1 nitroreductase family protein [Clostridium aciditolerans]
MIKEIETRRSIRKYSNKPVEDEKILQLIESARIAPSGSNTQPWHFIIVKSDLTREKLGKASHDQKWMSNAPIHIVCVADIRARINDDIDITLDEDSPQPELKLIIRDATIAIEHIVLEAENLGLGTCWVAWFVQEDIRPILNIPSDKYVVGIIPVGYADETPKARPRKKLEDIIHYENW